MHPRLAGTQLWSLLGAPEKARVHWTGSKATCLARDSLEAALEARGGGGTRDSTPTRKTHPQTPPQPTPQLRVWTGGFRAWTCQIPTCSVHEAAPHPSCSAHSTSKWAGPLCSKWMTGRTSVWLVETYQQAEAVCHLCRDKGDAPPEQRKHVLRMLRQLLPQPQAPPDTSSSQPLRLQQVG